MKKDFNIQGVNLVIEKITIAQLKKVTDIISNLEAGEKITVKGIADKLLSEKLAELAAALFGKEANKVDWTQVDYETIDEMMEAFFLLNPRLTQRLKSIINSFKLSVA